MDELVQHLGTSLNTPETMIIHQGQPNDLMYFIIYGDCIVNYTDHLGKDHYIHRFLTEGDLFGEVSCIYGCLTQASVMSRNYTTFAVLS